MPVGFFLPFAGLLIFQRRLVAMLNVVFAVPPVVNLVSASLPKCPTKMTLLTLLDAIILCNVARFGHQPFEQKPEPHFFWADCDIE